VKVEHVLTGYQVIDVDERHVGMTVDGQVVLVRKEDGLINATQIVKLTQESHNSQQAILHRLRRAKEYKVKNLGSAQNTWISIQCGKELCVELGLEEKLRPLLNLKFTNIKKFYGHPRHKLPAWGTHGRKNTWINIREGRALCVELGLGKKLRPLLNRGLKSDTDDSNTGSEDESTVDRLMFDKESKGSQSPFIELVYKSHGLVIRRSDWRINCTHIANQIAGRSMVPKLIGDLLGSAYDHVRGSRKHQGTYVDFDTGIEFCNRHELDRLAHQLVELKRTENERAAAVQQDPPVSSVLDDPTARPSAITPSASADSDYNINTAVLGQSILKGSPEPEDHTLIADAESEDSEEDDQSVEDDCSVNDGESVEDDDSLEDDACSVDSDVTQARAPRPTEPGDGWLPQQLKDDTETNHNQHVGGITYYSSRDFEPQDSELEEVKLGLQAPSRLSSRYGNMTDVSRSFLLAASDR